MIRNFAASITKEDDWYVAQCLEVDIVSQGETDVEALDNLKEALQLHFTPPCATVVPEVKRLMVDLPDV